jgi:hypothetical protein
MGTIESHAQPMPLSLTALAPSSALAPCGRRVEVGARDRAGKYSLDQIITGLHRERPCVAQGCRCEKRRVDLCPIFFEKCGFFPSGNMVRFTLLGTVRSRDFSALSGHRRLPEAAGDRAYTEMGLSSPIHFALYRLTNRRRLGALDGSFRDDAHQSQTVFDCSDVIYDYDYFGCGFFCLACVFPK